MKGFGDLYKSTKKGNKKTQPSKDQIIREAFKFHSQGNIPEAAKYYQYFINQGFEDHRVLSNYGGILNNIGRLREAELYTRKAIELKPDYAQAHSNLGNILKDLGNLQEAELYTRKAIELKPDYAQAHYNLGNTLKDLGKFKEAELSYRKAIELNPNYANAHFNLGNLLKNLRKLQEAELSYRKAIELKPGSAESYTNLGNVLRDRGKLQEAESLYRKAIELNPNLAEPYSNLGTTLKDLGKLQEAELSYRKAIELNPDYANANYNLGNLLIDLGKLQEAELYTRKAISNNPKFAEANANLGNLLKRFGKLQEAELSYRKAIELNPDLASVYFSLSVMNQSDKNQEWKNKLFSESFIINKSQEDQIAIYFARANFFHKEKNYKESAKCLELANNLKLKIRKSNPDRFLSKSKQITLEVNIEEKNKKKHKKYPENIFIVGMPRSGSTLLESILSMNNDVYDLGEINVLEESIAENKKNDQSLTLADIYLRKIMNFKNELDIITNKWLYNYHYAGIICNQIPNAKIIHCFRNPLDNILSIYRAHFLNGNEYSSSLIDSAKVYLDQEDVMNKYKTRFRAKIYDLNYDLLVNNPDQEIKSLILWLGWQWNDSYLSPHLNKRTISTASSVQVRSPINSKSIGGWQNYQDMLKPAIEILTKTNRYQNLIS